MHIIIYNVGVLPVCPPSASPRDPVPLVAAVSLTALPAVAHDAAPVAGPVAVLLVGTASLLSGDHLLRTEREEVGELLF